MRNLTHFYDVLKPGSQPNNLQPNSDGEPQEKEPGTNENGSRFATMMKQGATGAANVFKASIGINQTQN